MATESCLVRESALRLQRVTLPHFLLLYKTDPGMQIVREHSQQKVHIYCGF